MAAGLPIRSLRTTRSCGLAAAANGYYLGQTTATNGTLLGGTNPFCIQATINNSNTNGVALDVNGCYTNGAPYHPELSVLALGWAFRWEPLATRPSVAVCAFINGNGHAFVSNQILGPVAPSTNGCVGNLFEPTTLNVSALPGVHYFIIGGAPLPRPTASFTAIPSRGPAPLTVNFTDTSSGSPTSWAWTFGDGNSSTSQNPANAYPVPGDYTVTLIASNNAGGSSTNTTMINVYSPFAWWQQAYGVTNWRYWWERLLHGRRHEQHQQVPGGLQSHQRGGVPAHYQHRARRIPRTLT